MQWIFLTAFLAISLNFAYSTPLDDYVWAKDENYGWVDLETTLNGTTPGGTTWTGHLLNMTSQQWLTPEDVDRSLWWHYLLVIIPENVNFENNATLYVTGGSNTDNYPDASSEDVRVAAALAAGAGCITGAFFQVPNEHMLFAEDPIQKSRTEDAIIAYTWDHFLKDPTQPEWLVRLPMVKSVLRAMDATTEYVAATSSGAYKLDYYTVAGASKRGWTTWLVGAVDPDRVMAIVPIVLDAVNFVEFAHHQFKAYNGGWSFALQDYYDMDIMRRFDDPNMLTLQTIEDPYWYFPRLTMPKLICNAVGDEFQQPDDTHFWWKDLPEPKHFMMVPNAEHSMATGILQLVPAIGTWIEHLLTGREVPEFKWEIDGTTGDISVNLGDSVDKVEKVEKFYATSCSDRRDFRFANLDDPCTCGVAYDGTCANLKSFWKSEELTPSSEDGSIYVAHHDAPSDGTWAAFMVQVTYKEKPEDNVKGFIPISRKGELVFTTEVSIVPDVYPYHDCYLDSCDGPLV